MKRTPSGLAPERIKAWRLSHGWKQSIAAEKLGVGASTYYQYEDGKAPIPIPVAYACSAINAKLEPFR